MIIDLVKKELTIDLAFLDGGQVEEYEAPPWVKRRNSRSSPSGDMFRLGGNMRCSALESPFACGMNCQQWSNKDESVVSDDVAKYILDDPIAGKAWTTPWGDEQDQSMIDVNESWKKKFPAPEMTGHDPIREEEIDDYFSKAKELVGDALNKADPLNPSIDDQTAWWLSNTMRMSVTGVTKVERNDAKLKYCTILDNIMPSWRPKSGMSFLQEPEPEMAIAADEQPGSDEHPSTIIEPPRILIPLDNAEDREEFDPNLTAAEREAIVTKKLEKLEEERKASKALEDAAVAEQKEADRLNVEKFLTTNGFKQVNHRKSTMFLFNKTCPLHTAVARNDAAAVKLLVDGKADLTTKISGQTAPELAQSLATKNKLESYAEMFKALGLPPKKN
jgi:hypothetical protein